MLSINHIYAGYSGKKVLKDISISNLKGGELVGLIGPNASGKSTLFKSIAGLIKPLMGSIDLGSVELTQLHRRDQARLVAYMPQAVGCNAILTVFESVLLALKQTTSWRVGKEDLNQVSQVLDTLELSHLASRGIADLSGGQAQMVPVAQTLVRAPAVILLDEPTSALDLHHQLSIMNAIHIETKRRKPIVMAALHDLNLAAKFCDRLVLLNDGRIIADGSPELILNMPELGETYGVSAGVERTSRGALYVDAHLNSSVELSYNYASA